VLTQRALAYAETHRSRFIADLQDFVRIPTVSVQPQHASAVRRGAAWLAGRLRHAGLERVAVLPLAGHPLVYAEWRRRPDRPTVLIYGHYDVQPPDPLAAWHSPPFAASVRGDNLYGRGSSDDKGPVLAHANALEAYLQTGGTLPVNVICLFEGEEEIGSPHLPAFLIRHRAALRSDVAVMSDTRILGPDRPAITYSLRGALSLEIEVRGPRHDLHSGSFGGAVHDPLQVLCELLARLHDPQGRVAIPGFYDSVRSQSMAERTAMARSGLGDAEILRGAGVYRGWGEPGYSLYERTTIRPALTINGLSGGYQGPGGKAVIPAAARAKLNFRLVPDQNPHEIAQLLRRYLARLAPPTAQVRVRLQMTAPPAELPRTHPALHAAALAYRQGFGVPPVLVRSGGTIPVVNTLHETLGIPTVLLGFALPDDGMHAPNEKIHLPTFGRAIATCIWFLAVTGAHARTPGKTPARRAVTGAALQGAV
jgi:acetylornithine deacetylase/succinyl-diaminopimelate desuccinylase-like protein